MSSSPSAFFIADYHCAKSVQIRGFFWSVFSCIWSKYGYLLSPNTGKNGPEKTPYLDTFYAVRPFRSRVQNEALIPKLSKNFFNKIRVFASLSLVYFIKISDAALFAGPFISQETVSIFVIYITLICSIKEMYLTLFYFSDFIGSWW